MNTHTPALEVHDLARTYGEGAGAVAALAGVDLAFPPGTFTAVMGPSGSGKSTLLTAPPGSSGPPRAGSLIAGEDITDWSEDDRTRLRRERIGFVFQAFNLMPYLTAEQNVALPLRLAGRRPDRARVAALLERSASPTGPGSCPRELSGGQQQRVAIARALVTDPAVVFADEPTGALDSDDRARGARPAARRASTTLGQTVVMVTHDPVAAAYADTVVFLVDGRIAGRMDRPTADAVAGQMAHLDELVAGGGVMSGLALRSLRHRADRVHGDLRGRAARHRADRLVRHAGRDRHRPGVSADDRRR